MLIRFIDGLGRFTQVMKVAQLVGRTGKDGGYCFTDGELSIRDDSIHCDFSGQHFFGFSQQNCKLFL
jgi:hypothetical protein